MNMDTSPPQETYGCPRHGTQIVMGQPCQACIEAFNTRRATADMTVDERVTELRSLDGPLTIPFDQVHQRIEELVGRPVWTHEIASWDKLIAEVRDGKQATFADVLDKIPAGKSVIVVEP